MARTAEDLKALITAGDEYTETIQVEYLGELFDIQIRPLTDEGLTNVNRQMKLNAAMLKRIAAKLKAGESLTPAEAEKAKSEAVDAILEGSDGEIEIGQIDFMDFMLNREFCRAGIVDAGLRSLVPKFRYGLTGIIAKRIQTISTVPPQVIANFFGQ
jgi:hypothetical protein